MFIKFGTDGWRGIIARDFTFSNVELVAQAVAMYVKHRNLARRGIIVGYDNRFLSDQFARTVAEVLSYNGIPVYLFKKSAPTPVIAFAIKEYGAGGAVMITASHNPPEYNGLKFIPEYAGPALPHITKEIEDNINILKGKEESFQNQGIRSNLQEINPNLSYFKHLNQLVDLKAIGKKGLKIAVDPMYGAGIGFLEDILKDAGAHVRLIHNIRDPLFGGVMPDPAERSLNELRSLVVESNLDLGLALDGDADRFGVIDRDGSYIAPNQFLPLVYYHLITARGVKGSAVRTVATTHLLDRIAGYYGQQVFETPVGFKYIGQHMIEKGCLLGGEESGGLSIKGHVPEKDGVLADLLAAEIVAYHGKSLKSLMEEVWSIFGHLYSERLDIHTGQEEKERILEKLKELSPEEVAGKKVVRCITVDGTKLVMEDGSWLLIRASGTESLFRVYVEANNREDLNNIQKWCKSLISNKQ